MAAHDLITLTNPSGAETDVTIFVNLENMSASWWAAVTSSDGTRGRVYKGDGSTELACDWINFDDTGETGILAVLWSGTLSSAGTQQLWVEPPVSTNASVGATDTYGSDNAYRSTLEGFWPDLGTDRTSNGNDGTPQNGATIGNTTGPMGDATTLGGGSDYRVDVSGFDVTSGEWTVISLNYLDSYSSIIRMIMTAPDTGDHGFFVRNNSSPGVSFNWGGYDGYDWSGRVAYDTSEWQATALRMNASDIDIYVADSTASASNNRAGSYSSSRMTGLTFGGAPLTSLYWQGEQQFNMIYSDDIGDNLTEYTISMIIDNATFIGTPTWVDTGETGTAADGIDFSDSATAQLAALANSADSIIYSDQATGLLGLNGQNIDGIVFADSATGEIQTIATVADGLVFGDAAIAVVNRQAQASDTIIYSDSAVGATEGPQTGSCADGLIYGDTASATVNRNAVANDSIVFTDSAIANIITYANAYDGIVIGDTASCESDIVGVVSVTFTSNKPGASFTSLKPGASFASSKPGVDFEGE